MEKIRKGVFETNSSSTHSFTLGDKLHKTFTPVKDIEVICEEFGWGREHFTDTMTKLSYLITGLFQNFENVDDIENSPNRELYDKLCKIVKDYLGVGLKVIKGTDDYHQFGYIDHQSENLPLKILNSNRGQIERFLFSNQSILKIDNDNH